MYRPKPSHLVLSLLVLTAAMFAACLWPYNSAPVNEARWVPGGRGIRIAGMGCVVGREPFPSLARISPGGSLTVEITVRPAKLPWSGVPTILTFHPDAGPSPLMIGAWKNSLLVRLGRGSAPGSRKYREIGSRDAFRPGDVTVLTVAAGPAGTALYHDGTLMQPFPDAPLEGAYGNLGRLLLGISPTGSGEWKGDILGLRIYNRALTETEVRLSHETATAGDPAPRTLQGAIVAAYDFGEGTGRIVGDRTGRGRDLIVPERYQPLKRVILALPTDARRWRLSFASDVVLNIAGFVPFALLSTWALVQLTRLPDGWKATLVVAASALLSLSFELIQVFLPTRSSSLTDLLTNVLGAAVGVALFYALELLSLLPSKAKVRNNRS